MRLGFVGAGRMGRPMVDRLTGAGHEVRVLARSEQARKALDEGGAHPVASAADAARDAEAVFVCVFSDDQVREVSLHLVQAMPDGAVLVVHTTGSPRTVRDIAAAAPAIRVVDAPVSGGPHDIAAGRITLFVGGDAGTVDLIRPALGCYGDPILHVGPLGAGQGVKLVNNALFAAQIGLLADAVRLGGEIGVPEAGLLTALQHGSSANLAVRSAAARGSVAQFTAAVRDFIGKDVAVVRDVAAGLGASLGRIDAAIGALEPSE
jgi:3-hydroxyisobutyrate dehydrogenase-like beta-hydroxyacid dehydrogenase